MAKKTATVVQPEVPVSVEILAESIKAISDGVRAMRRGRLNDKCLILLIQHAAPAVDRMGRKPGVAEVRAVLDAMESLESTYLKKSS